MTKTQSLQRKAAISKAVAKYRAKNQKTASAESNARKAAIRKAIAKAKAQKQSVNSIMPDQKKIDMLATRIAARIENKMERILADTEEVIKDNVPARYVGHALRNMTASLSKEGIGSQWDFKLTRAQRSKTAGIECSGKDVEEACNEITNAVVAETEELLEQADDTVMKMAAKHFKMRRVATRRLRNAINAILAKKGLNVNLEGEDEGEEA